MTSTKILIVIDEINKFLYKHTKPDGKNSYSKHALIVSSIQCNVVHKSDHSECLVVDIETINFNKKIPIKSTFSTNIYPDNYEIDKMSDRTQEWTHSECPDNIKVSRHKNMFKRFFSRR